MQFGSIYGVLRTLVDSGHVKRLGVERQGQRPERTRYAITPSGREHFRELLRTAWRRLPSPADPINLALAARSELPDQEVIELIAERARELGRRMVALEDLRRSSPDIEIPHRQELLTAAELRWARSLTATLGWEAQPGDMGGESAMEKKLQHPLDVQLIVSLVIRRVDGQVLLARYEPEDERWWLPGADLIAYEHPEEAAARVLESLPGLRARQPTFAYVDSFRGRRGWHVVFHYAVRAVGEPGASVPTAWFDPKELPRTMHGPWEKEAIGRVANA